ncbi:unnamed protein product [Leuciscus chuanchicus]
MANGLMRINDLLLAFLEPVISSGKRWNWRADFPLAGLGLGADVRQVVSRASRTQGHTHTHSLYRKTSERLHELDEHLQRRAGESTSTRSPRQALRGAENLTDPIRSRSVSEEFWFSEDGTAFSETRSGPQTGFTHASQTPRRPPIVPEAQTIPTRACRGEHGNSRPGKRNGTA